MPTDPLGGVAYLYASFPAACTDYHIGATLEEGTNPALKSDADAAASLAVVCPGSGADFAGADPVYDLKP